MPFDDTSTREKTEIEILDEMAIQLAKPELWTKTVLEINGARCLNGALNFADHGSAQFDSMNVHRLPRYRATYQHLASLKVYTEMERLARQRGYHSPANFNNSVRHEDVLLFLAETRQVFARETANAVR